MNSTLAITTLHALGYRVYAPKTLQNPASAFGRNPATVAEVMYNKKSAKFAVVATIGDVDIYNAAKTQRIGYLSVETIDALAGGVA